MFNLDIDEFKKLALQGLNCKQIMEHLNLPKYNFGLKFKQMFGDYPSVYIHKVKHGKA